MPLFCLNLLPVVFCLVSVLCEFVPLTDNDLFSIKWAGPKEELLGEEGDLEVVNVQTAENEKYQCVIPESQASQDATRKANYAGATPDELMEKLFQQNQCSYRIESYWTYELCHGRYIRQYHENKEMGLQKPKLQEYYLGKGKEKKKTGTDSAGEKQLTEEKTETYESTEENKAKEIPIMKVDGLELPYYSVNMSDGTVCDLTGKPRKSHVMYICQPDGRGEIYLLKETSSCEYDIIVLTSVLCSNPLFKPKDPPVIEIKCHSLGGSPWRPKHLQKLETEVLTQEKTDDIIIEVSPSGSSATTQQPSNQQPSPKQTTSYKQTSRKQDATIGPMADKQLLRDFLNGDYCLHGGGGWWKHEFCYGKYAKQYHSDQDGQVDIVLGNWNKVKHLQWLADNPGKKPKNKGNRKQLSLFYSDGDTCDLTGKSRYVEVKLKCLNKPQQPHAVTIYLVEPKSCEYILGVESPIFCDLLDQADSDGLLDHIKLQ